MRRKHSCSPVLNLLHGHDDHFGSPGSNKGASKISSFEKVAVDARGRQRLRVSFGILDYRVDKNFRIADRLSFVKVAAGYPPDELYGVSGKALIRGAWIV